ncbi:ankyrin-3-like [Telopea speciosissima]|uniref:ankyrin-3-like n=1 Tax=Telopea speciosissima TaxID=54955 RepID=UPI001CC5D8C3|nr:ankyrin-3-like [Telopea speciosissima]
MGFFLSCWDTIKSDVFKAIRSFFFKPSQLAQVNQTIICLILKKDGATSLSIFRLISLCNLLYKFIAKILANIIKAVIPLSSALINLPLFLKEVLRTTLSFARKLCEGWNAFSVLSSRKRMILPNSSALLAGSPSASPNLKEVKRLLDEGMDVNVAACGPKSQGVTPLHLAAHGGHLKVMDELLERGANIDARTKGACGWTPLHNAAKERKREAIRFLVENGAFLPPDINDNRFNPPAHYCPGLEWAYEELKRLQEGNLSSTGEITDSSES